MQVSTLSGFQIFSAVGFRNSYEDRAPLAIGPWGQQSTVLLGYITLISKLFLRHAHIRLATMI